MILFGRLRTLPRSLVVGLALSAAGCALFSPNERTTPSSELEVERGSLAPRLLLTGELEAVESLRIGVPRTTQYRVQVKWLVEDGTEVEAGNRIVDFDNAPFAATLEDKRLAALRERRSLEQKVAEVEAKVVQAEIAVEQRRIELAKAELDASIPRDLMSEREYRKAVLALESTRTEHTKAVEDLSVKRSAGEAEIEVQRIELEKAKRDARSTASAIDELSIVAPRKGIVIVADIPWEGRKVQVGDTLFTGRPVAEMPDLGRMQVRARLSDVDDGLVEIGMRVRCTLDTYPDLEVPGRVTEVTPVAQEPDRRSLRRFFDVLVELEGSDPERMRPGMSVKVEVPLGVIADAPLVPRAALDLGADPPRVLLANGSWREVELGPCSAQACQLLGSLDQGEELAPVGGAS